MKQKWIRSSKTGITRLLEDVPADELQLQLRALDTLTPEQVADLKWRKMASLVTVKSFRVTKVRMQGAC